MTRRRQACIYDTPQRRRTFRRLYDVAKAIRECRRRGIPVDVPQLMARDCRDADGRKISARLAGTIATQQDDIKDVLKIEKAVNTSPGNATAIAEAYRDLLAQDVEAIAFAADAGVMPAPRGMLLNGGLHDDDSYEEWLEDANGEFVVHLGWSIGHE